IPDLEKGIARIQVRTTVVNALEKQAELSVAWTVIEEQTGREVLSSEARRTVVRAGGQEAVEFPERVLASPLLWHFDAPTLYRIIVSLSRAGQTHHPKVATFGIRRIEIRDAVFYLVGERVWLAGVDRMAGSLPEYGMAAP